MGRRAPHSCVVVYLFCLRCKLTRVCICFRLPRQTGTGADWLAVVRRSGKVLSADQEQAVPEVPLLPRCARPEDPHLRCWCQEGCGGLVPLLRAHGQVRQDRAAPLAAWHLVCQAASCDLLLELQVPRCCRVQKSTCSRTVPALFAPAVLCWCGGGGRNQVG